MNLRKDNFFSRVEVDKVEKPAEQKIEIPSQLKGITEKEVNEVAEMAWPLIMKEIREKVGKPKKPDEYWGHFSLPLQNEPDRKIELAYISTTGCGHLKRGGCTFCDYGSREKVNRAKMMEGAKDALNLLEESNKNYRSAFFNITPSGSFCDEKEFPLEVQDYILNRIKTFHDLNRGNKVDEIEFITETRLEYVTEEKIKHMRDILGDEINIEIGYGMESTNELVREGICNKHLPEDFQEKLNILKKYKIKIAGHVITKPPLLTEKEAIDDAVKSIKEMFFKGNADIIINMTMNARKGTLVGELKEMGFYELPKIWTSIEIMRQIGSEMSFNTRMFGFSIDSGNSAETVCGCEECNSKIMPLIINYSGREEEYNKIISTADSINCQCKQEWQRRIDSAPISTIPERVATIIDSLGKQYISKGFKDFN